MSSRVLTGLHKYMSKLCIYWQSSNIFSVIFHPTVKEYKLQLSGVKLYIIAVYWVLNMKMTEVKEREKAEELRKKDKN